MWKNTALVVSGRSGCSNDHSLQVKLTLFLVVNVTDKVARSCCRPVMPGSTELSDLFNTFNTRNLSQ